MPVDQHNGDRRQETRNGLIQMAKAELQAHDAVGLLHPSVDEMLQLAKHASSLGDTDPARAIVMAVPTNNKPARPSLVAASSDNQDYLALFNDAENAALCRINELGHDSKLASQQVLFETCSGGWD